jgi:hypothetical protein
MLQPIVPGSNNRPGMTDYNALAAQGANLPQNMSGGFRFGAPSNYFSQPPGFGGFGHQWNGGPQQGIQPLMGSVN